MKSQEYLLNEYKKNGKKPVYCKIAKQNIVVPYSYKGNIEAFIDDLFSFQDDNFKEFNKYNKSNTKSVITEPEPIKIGDAFVATPLNSVLKKHSRQKIINNAINRANRVLQNAVYRTMRANKQYPEKIFMLSLKKEEKAKLNWLDARFKAMVVGKAVYSATKFGVKQAASVTIGTVGALPLAAYFFLDKKYKFAKNSFGQKVVNEVKKGAIKAAAVATLLGGYKVAEKQTEKFLEKQKTELMKNNYQEYNKKVFEESINEIKVILAFVENGASKTYEDGEGYPTTGYGTTFFVNDAGKGDRTIDNSPKLGDEISMKEADVQKTRYLQHVLYQGIEDHITRPLSKREMVACSIFGYCLGNGRIGNSDFGRAINKGDDLSKTVHLLGGFREQPGVPKRLYYVALYLAGYLDAKDFLDFRTETCYLHPTDYSTMCEYKKGKLLKDKNGHVRFKFDEEAVKFAKEITQTKKNSKIINFKGTKECLPVREILLPEIVNDIENKKEVETLNLAKLLLKNMKTNS